MIAPRSADDEGVRTSHTWLVIPLSAEQVKTGHFARIVETFADLFIAAGSPSGVAMFADLHDDGGRDVYLNPPAAILAGNFGPANGARPCAPPVDEGEIELLVGHEGDRRLLSS